MSSGSAEIKATPTLAISTQMINVDLKAASARQLENEYKYTYNFGIRQLADALVDLRRDSNYYAYPQDVELLVSCQAEEGYRLAFAEIKVDQSSIEREALIFDGGIGEDHISILVKARNTNWFYFESRMYAKKKLLNKSELYKDNGIRE